MKKLKKFLSKILISSLIFSVLPIPVQASEKIEQFYSSSISTNVETKEDYFTDLQVSKNAITVNYQGEVNNDREKVIEQEGTWGDNLFWTLNEAGTLTISGVCNTFMIAKEKLR